MSGDLQRSVEDFLYREADLMDSHDYDQWFALWTQELIYWVPSNQDQYDPQQHVSIIFDDRKRLEERIFRLKSKFIHSQSPRSRLARVIANIRVTPSASDLLEVSSKFVLTEVRGEQERIWAGRLSHILHSDPTGYRIQKKTVYLVNNDSVLSNLTFLI